MLFDLRARGRRKTVQVVFLGLACCSCWASSASAWASAAGAAGSSTPSPKTAAPTAPTSPPRWPPLKSASSSHPTEAAAWAALVEAQLHQASEPGNIATVWAKPKSTPPRARRCLPSWPVMEHLPQALEPHHPRHRNWRRGSRASSPNRASISRRRKVRALQVAVKGNPTVRLYSALAVSAYKAGNLKVGDAAAHKAVSLAPAAERTQVKKYLAELRKNPLSHTPATISKGANGTVRRDAGRQDLHRQVQRPEGRVRRGCNHPRGSDDPAGHRCATATRRDAPRAAPLRASRPRRPQHREEIGPSQRSAWRAT